MLDIHEVSGIGSPSVFRCHYIVRFLLLSFNLLFMATIGVSRN